VSPPLEAGGLLVLVVQHLVALSLVLVVVVEPTSVIAFEVLAPLSVAVTPAVTAPSTFGTLGGRRHNHHQSASVQRRRSAKTTTTGLSSSGGDYLSSLTSSPTGSGPVTGTTSNALIDATSFSSAPAQVRSAATLLVESKSLSLAAADEIASLAVAAAQQNSFSPVCVCVLDSAGYEIVTKRMDGCPPIAYSKLSHAKANTCLAVQSSSRTYGAKYLRDKDGNPSQSDVYARVLNQVMTVQGDLAAFQGGVLIRDRRDGSIVGSIGVSGAAGDEDEYCAIVAVKSCSLSSVLISEPADHSCATAKY